MLFKAEGDSPGEDEYDSGPDRGGKVGVDAPDADFGQQCGGGGEECGQERPEEPGHGSEDTRRLRLDARLRRIVNNFNVEITPSSGSFSSYRSVATLDFGDWTG